jgi:hypothetical protein
VFPPTRRNLLRIAIAYAVFAAHFAYAQPAGKTRNIIFVMTDGLRWQEVFNGADAKYISKEGGVSEPEEVRNEYWRDTVEARREALMPFLWRVVAKKGQIFGNRDAGSEASVTNGFNFSYPGYSETFCGFADARVDSNKKRLNPNPTVLEWLHQMPEFRGKIAAFAAWDVFPFIFNAERAGFVVNAGYDPLVLRPRNDRIDLINRMKPEIHYWDDEPFDTFTFHTTVEYWKQAKPRILYLSLGETDEWAHHGDYAAYLRAARSVDSNLKELWEMAQANPQFRDSTTLIFSCDHGRGATLSDWRKHGEEIEESKYMFMAFLGPDTPALGARHDTAPVKQNQIAATLAKLLGKDYNAKAPKAGQPIADVLPK